MGHSKVTDVSSEDLDSLSDYNAINYNNGKTNRKKNEANLAGHITKQSSTVNHTRMKTYRTNNFSFFNVFFDIVFWPFVFLRAKQWYAIIYCFRNLYYLSLRDLSKLWFIISDIFFIIINREYEQKHV